MTQVKRILLILSFIVAAVPMQERPLPANAVSQITADGEYLWLVTDAGLCRFHVPTRTMTLFSPGKSGLPDSSVRSTALAPDGTLYVALDGAVARFNGLDFELVTDRLHPEIIRIEIDRNGIVWVMSGVGLYRYDGSSWSFIWVLPPGNFYRQMPFDLASDGTPWVCGSWGLGKVEGDSVITVAGDYRNISSIAIDRNDHIWVARRGELIETEKDYTRNSYLLDPMQFPEFPHNWVYALYVDNSGQLWVGGMGWLATFDGISWAVYDRFDSEKLAENGIADIYLDPDNILWLGTGSTGLLRYDGYTWKQYDVIPNNAGAADE